MTLKRINSFFKIPVIYFLIKVSKLLIFLFILDFLIGSYLQHHYFQNQQDFEYRTTYSIDSTKANLLIFGSSRASHHYRPDIFENKINLTSYNVGRDGQFLLYNYAVLKAILKRYSPKIIILDFVPGELIKNNDAYERLSALLPYYRNHIEMRKIIDLRSSFEKYKLISHIYPFNSSLLTIVKHNITKEDEKRTDISGYLPLTEIWTDSIKTQAKSENLQIDPILVNALKMFIEDCHHSGVKVFVICSPIFEKRPFPDTSIQIAKQIAEKYHVAFLDYLKDSSFVNHRMLFADPAHLNNKGAEMFSDTICSRIKYILPY